VFGGEGERIEGRERLGAGGDKEQGDVCVCVGGWVRGEEGRGPKGGKEKPGTRGTTHVNTDG